MSQPGRNADFLSDQQVDIIATRLAERLSASSASPTQIAAAHNKPSSTPRAELGEGVFATVDDAVAAAGVAFRELDGMTLEGRHKIIASIRESMFEHAEELAHTHQRKSAHVDGDDDGFGGTERVEGQEAEAGRTIDDRVVIVELAGIERLMELRYGVLLVLQLLLKGAQQYV